VGRFLHRPRRTLIGVRPSCVIPPGRGVRRARPRSSRSASCHPAHTRALGHRVRGRPSPFEGGLAGVYARVPLRRSTWRPGAGGNTARSRSPTARARTRRCVRFIHPPTVAIAPPSGKQKRLRSRTNSAPLIEIGFIGGLFACSLRIRVQPTGRIRPPFGPGSYTSRPSGAENQGNLSSGMPSTTKKTPSGGPPQGVKPHRATRENPSP